MIVAGAYLDDVGGSAFHGSAWSWRWDGSSWVDEQQLPGSDQVGSDNFGESVAVSGDLAVVGAHLDQVGGNVSQGSAWVFRRTGSGWIEERHLVVAAGAAGDEFGIGVGVSGSVAVVGAYRDVVPGFGNTGSAYVFDLLGSAWSWLGQGLAGSNGLPALAGLGDLGAGSSVSFVLSHARPAAPVVLVVGLSDLSAPIKGGVLVPSPDIVLSGFATDAAGQLTLTSTWPAGVPSGASFWGQEWVVDPAGPSGLAASNGIVGTAP